MSSNEILTVTSELTEPDAQNTESSPGLVASDIGPIAIAEKVRPVDDVPELSELSKLNLEAITAEFESEALRVGMFGSSEQVRTALQAEAEAVGRNPRLTVNMSGGSLRRLLSSGQHQSAWSHLREAGSTDQMKTSGTAQNKYLHDSYFDFRDQAEAAYRRYVTPDSAQYDPIYAALAGGTSDQDSRFGACPEYGEAFVELRPVETDSVVYCFGDSHSRVGTTQRGHEDFDESALLDFPDAIKAKAIVNLMRDYNRRFPITGGSLIDMGKIDETKLLSLRAGYIEAAVFDEINLDDVETIGLAVSDSSLPELADITAAHPEIADRLKLNLDGRVPPITREWLSSHYSVTSAETNDSAPKPDAPGLAQEIGLSPDDSYETTAAKLDEAATTAWDSRSMMIIRISHMTHQIPNDVGQRIKLLRGESRRTYMYTPEQAADIERLISIESERLFFKVQEPKQEK